MELTPTKLNIDSLLIHHVSICSHTPEIDIFQLRLRVLKLRRTYYSAFEYCISGKNVKIALSQNVATNLGM